MKDYMYLGSAPSDEDCVQVGSSNYKERAEEECKRYIDLIRKKLGPEPEGALLRIKWDNHDFGRYAEVCVSYETQNEQAVDYAFRCEAEAPTCWEADKLGRGGLDE